MYSHYFAAMILRAYGNDDYAQVVELVVAVLVEYGFGANIGGVQRDLAEAATAYAIDGAGFWVAESEARIVGTVAIRPKDERICELKRLYVRKDARGLGVGRALYAHAEAFARNAGYDTIWLDSSRKFTEARRLYEKNGFTLIEEIQNDWSDNVYSKRLV